MTFQQLSIEAMSTVVGGANVVTRNDVNVRLLNAWDQYAAGMKATAAAGLAKANAVNARPL